MTTEPLLDTELARLLRANRNRVVPFAGAGITASAGAPTAAALAVLIAEQARARGAEVSTSFDFNTICAAVTTQLGHEQLQLIVSEIIGGIELEPTPSLTRIAHAPSQIVVTTNYDYGVEAAGRQIGLEPLTLHPRSALVTAAPAAGQLIVVHIHGVHDEPTSIVLPGRSVEELESDEPFKTALRMLLAPHAVLYLGYSFPDSDDYLRTQIEWIRDNLTDTGEHLLLLPEDEYENRRTELDGLGAAVRIFTFDSSRGYDAVQQAALTLAPSREVVAARVTRIVGSEVTQDFAAPPILKDAIDSDTDKRNTRAMMARLGMGEDKFAEPHELLEAGRSLVIAEPGMGKTQLLLHLGGRAAAFGFAALYLPAKAISGAISPQRDTETRLALALVDAKAFDDTTPAPTVEELPRSAFVFLIDGLDEVDAERRGAVVAAIGEFVNLFPQHAFVVATRPLLERAHAESLHRVGFSIYRLVLDETWGQNYLRETRGIPQQTLNELYERLPRASELLAIPLYAALIGNRLAEGVEALPDTALQLITEVGVRDAIRDEATKRAVPVDDLYRYLQTLALVLEVRGINEARIDEVLRLPAPAGLSGEEARTWLIEQALLKDLPDRVAFQTVTIQEGLAAEALLSTRDPLASLYELAVAEVAGEQIIRVGIDHALDLLFESFPKELRPALRELDPLRWARTQTGTIEVDEARETLRFIWEHFAERRNWIDSDRQRELRDARSTVERLTLRYPELIEEIRSKLLEALDSTEETARGNALFYLGQAPFDAATAERVGQRLLDPNSVVRRFAASTIAAQHEETLREALIAAYRVEADELAASEIAHALLSLAQEGERLPTVRLLMENQMAWRRISYMAEGLPLTELLTILEETGIQNDDGRALEHAVEALPAERWTADDVRRLVALLVRSAQHSYYQFRNFALLRELVELHPDAAITGAESAANEDTSYMDIQMLRFIDRQRLERASEGPLGTQLGLLIELLIDRPAAAPKAPATLPTSKSLSLHEWIADDRVSPERCPTRDTVLNGLLNQVPDLTTEERDKLELAVNAWWPSGALADSVSTDGRNGSAPACFPAALAGSAALSLPIERERWLELLHVTGLWFHPGASEWMAANYPPDAEEEVIAHLESLTDDYLLTLALQAVPALSDRVALGFADAVIRIGHEHLAFRLDRLREENKLTALWKITTTTTEVLRRAALRELARAHDVDAQRLELQAVMQDLEANPRAYENQGLEWHDAVMDEVLPELGELLTLVSRTWNPSESQIGRTTVAAIATIGNEEGLAVYERLMSDEDAIGGSFYWYERERLRRQLAGQRVLARIPEDLGTLAEWLAELGWHVN